MPTSHAGSIAILPGNPSSAEQALERQTTRKAWRHIVPLMAFVLLLNYLDRVNLGFAALQMNKDLGLSNTQFGVAAGCFAIGYALFGIPSTLALHRLGARRWIGLIMVVWGLFSAATAWVSSAEQLMLVRLLLGAAEAGFVPGVIYYFTSWFPSAYRGRALGTFLAIGPLGFVIGGPISSVLLSWDGRLGLAGWQWLFIVEALPTVAFAWVIWRLLPDKPADARWLTAEEKVWLNDRLAREQRSIRNAQAEISVWRTFANRRVWLLAAIYLAFGTSGIGAIYFLPLMIGTMGFSTAHTALLTSVPAAIAALAVPLWGVWTDRARSREAVVATAALAVACGLLGAAVLLPSPWALVPFSVALIGHFGFVAPFWTLPAAFLTGASAAAGIAFINVVGNIANFSGPALLGRMSDLTHSYAFGLQCLAVSVACAALIMTVLAIRNRNVPR